MLEPHKTPNRSIPSKKLFIRLSIAAVIFAAICFAAAYAQPHKDPHQPKWYSIIPPLLAITAAFLTRNVLLSLLLAICTGAIIVEIPNTQAIFLPLETVSTTFATFSRTITGDNIVNLEILLFVFIIFVTIEVLITTGGFQGLVNLLLKFIKGRKSAQVATILLGICYFIDDYSSCIVTGSAMRPVTDRFKVSREKLAFIVDATSAPVSGLAVISTWIAYEVGLFNDLATDLNITKSGYAMFFDAISFRFYCLLMLFFMFLNAFSGREFGPMRHAEQKAKLNPDDPPDDPPALASHPSAKARYVLIPLLGLILFHLVALWISGKGPQTLKNPASLVSWSYWKNTITNVNNTTILLVYASLFALVLAFVCAFFSAKVKTKIITKACFAGILKSILPCAILLCAWALKNTTDNLQTGQFLSSILASSLSPLYFPAILFLIACLTSFATGTSWGTMAILLPTAIPIAFTLDGNTYGPITIISLAAVLDGAIFGDHCSPISDTTIISAIASKCDLMQHVRTQLPYSIFVAAIALICGYLPSAFGFAPIYVFIFATLTLIAAFFLITQKYKTIPVVKK